MTKKIKVWILWTWAVAYRWYLRWLCWKNETYEVSVLCDKREDVVKNAAHDFWVKNFCTHIYDLIKYDLDIIVVLTRHEDHYENIKYILNHWIHVYSEKPFSSCYKEWEELLLLAKDKWLQLWSAPQIMLSSRNKKLKELISEGFLWKITLIKASCSNMWPAGRKDTNYDPEWFYNSWGSLKSLWIYTLSILIWIFWMPKKIVSYMWISLPERKVLYWPFKWKEFRVTAYDNVISQFDFWGWTYAFFDGSYSVPHQSQNEFEIHGEKGSLFISWFWWIESIKHKDIDGFESFIWPDDDCHIKWNLSLWVEETISAIIENRENKTHWEFALNVIRVMDLMEKSSQENIVVLL